PRADGGIAAAEVYKARARVGGEAAEGDVVGDRAVLGEAFAFAIFGDHADAGADARAGRSGRREGSDFERAGADGVEGVERTQEFGAAGADEARDAEDFAAAKREGDTARRTPAGDVLGREDWLTECVRHLGIEVVDLAAGHQRDDLRVRSVG